MTDFALSRLAPRQTYWRGAPTPRIKGKPILGCLSQIREDPLNFFTNVRGAVGDVAEIDVAGDRLLMICDPATIEHVLESNGRNYRKSRFFKRLRTIWGMNVIMEDGEEWRRQRRMVQPAFTRKHVDQTSLLMTGAALSLMDRWRDAARERRPVDVLGDLMDTALHVLVRSVFGVDVGARGLAIGQALATMLTVSEQRLWLPFAVPLNMPFPGNRAAREAVREFDAAIYGLIRERRESGERRGDILDAFLEMRDENGQPLPERQLRDEIAGVIVAGHETTGSTLAWALEALSRYPETLRRLRAEADAVLGRRVPTAADAPNLRWHRMTLQETMRLRPPVWTMSREAIEDDVIGGLRIRRGTAIMMPQYVVHRRGESWANPEGFDPARFADGEPTGAEKYSYFPFGGGPRKCLGLHFSMTEMLIVLPMIVQNFSLSLVPGHPVEMKPMVTLRPAGGLWMTVEEVERGPQLKAA